MLGLGEGGKRKEKSEKKNKTAHGFLRRTKECNRKLEARGQIEEVKSANPKGFTSSI
jgi:hypothetical protein